MDYYDQVVSTVGKGNVTEGGAAVHAAGGPQFPFLPDQEKEGALSALDVVRRWVEEGIAPDRIVARTVVDDENAAWKGNQRVFGVPFFHWVGNQTSTK